MARVPRAPLVPEVEPERLSRQQREIWRLAREGKTVKEIAQALRISAVSVKTHLHYIRIKFTQDTQKRLAVKRALKTLSDNSFPDLTKQETVELLTRTGHFSARAVAEHIGSTPGAVRVMKLRAKAAQERPGRVITRQASREELNFSTATAIDDTSFLPSLLYEAYVDAVDRAPAEVREAQRLLAALGAGGAVIREIAFADRRRHLNALIAQDKRLIKAFARDDLALIEDVIEQEFLQVEERTYKPRRGVSWRVLLLALAQRFEVACAGRLAVTRCQDRWREGLPLYQVRAADEIIAAVRRTAAGTRVAAAERIYPAGRVELRGRILAIDPARGTVRLEAGAGEAEEVTAAGVVLALRGERYAVYDVGMLDKNDAVAVRTGGWVCVDNAKDFRVVPIEGERLARLAAWCLIQEPCWVELIDPEEQAVYRCELPVALSVAAVPAQNLEVAEGAAEGETVRVRPAKDGKYVVLAGKDKALKAKEAGLERIPAVIEKPFVV